MSPGAGAALPWSGLSRVLQSGEAGVAEALHGLELPDAKTANQVLKSLARKPLQARRLLEAWEERHVDISAFHYSTVVTACGRARDWREAVAMLSAMETRKVRSDTVVYNSAISACARASWTQALQLFEMLTGAQLAPDTLTFNCLISGCDWQRSLQLLVELKRYDLVPDLVTYNAAMRGCQNAKQWTWALKLMEDMSEYRLAKDEITYTTALSGLDQQWHLASRLLGELQLSLVRPDAQVYTAFVGICGRASQWPKALDCLEEALSQQVACDTSMYNALITACGLGMEWQASLALLEALPGSPDQISLGATLSACSGARQWQVALAIAGSASNAKLNTSCFNALLGGCSWDMVLAILEEMDRRHVEKDSVTISTALTACERAEEWDACFHLLDQRLLSCQDRRLRRAPWAPGSFLRHRGGHGLELRRLLRACGRELGASFRLNPLKAKAEILDELWQQGWKLSPVPWLRDGFRVTNWQPTMGFNRQQLLGELYFQEQTSMLPAQVLQSLLAASTASSSRSLQVLDMCAAPGSKSTQLGSWLMELQVPGLLVANEPDAQRARKLEASLLRMGVSGALVTCADGRDLGALAPERFDAILADVPCSCEGNVRKDAAALLSACGTSQEAPASHKEELVERQQGILCSAWRALKPGGFLVYSTCTFDYWENKGQCKRFLSAMAATEHPPVPVDVMSCLDLPISAGGHGGSLQLWPQRFDVEGFFVAAFRKGGEDVVDEPPGPALSRPFRWLEQFHLELMGPDESRKLREEALEDDTLGFWPPGDHRLAESPSGEIYLLPEMHGDLGDLSEVLRSPGLCVARRDRHGAAALERSELLLLAGGRAASAAQRSTESWAQLQAKKEAGGKWSPSRMQRKARNEAMIEAGKAAAT